MNYPAWTNAQSLRLLEEFKKQECLWDPKNSFFFNATLKEAAWDDLSQIIGHRKAECKRKMESLKGSFRRERSRANRAKKGIGAPFTSKWFAFETMKFLEEREDFRTCYSNPPPEQFGEIRLVGDTQQFVQYTLQDINEKDPHWENKTHESDVDLDDDDDTPIDCEPFSVVDVDDPLPESEEKYSHTGPCSEVQNIPKSVINPSSPSDSPQAETFSVTTSHSPRREEKSLGCTCQDEYATYGQHVANKLRKLDDRSRAFVQHKINTLLYKAEIKMLGGDECI